MKMTLQETITCCLDKSSDINCPNAKEYEQIASWLIELRDIRAFVEPLRSFNTNHLYLEELKKLVKQTEN